MFSLFKQKSGQASVEAALILPVILMIIALIVEPVCLLYTKTVMDGACAEGLRVATTTSDIELIESYIRRRLKAIPEVPLFHKGGEKDWNISIEKKDKNASIEITGHAAAMPPIGWCLFLVGQVDGQGIVLKSILSVNTYPDWIEGSYADWIAFWKGES